MATSLVAILLSLIAICAAQQGSFLPVNISEAVIRGQTPGVCPSAQMLDSQLTATRGEIDAALTETVAPIINCPCGGAGPWRRIAGMDFSDPSVPCPSGFTTINSDNVRGCGRSGNAGAACNSITFPAMGQSYSRVCGQVNAYQYASVDALVSGIRGEGLEGTYLDGISLTYGPAGSRQHVWSFVAALYEMDPNFNPIVACPCTNTAITYPHTYPDFIGNNYFCDTGNSGPGWQRRLYADDPMWDGAGCGPTSACCDFNNPPWFCTALPQPTTSDIEMRVCHDQAQGDEDTVLGLVDIFVM